MVTRKRRGSVERCWLNTRQKILAFILFLRTKKENIVSGGWLSQLSFGLKIKHDMDSVVSIAD
jgi:hypothetical protein